MLQALIRFTPSTKTVLMLLVLFAVVGLALAPTLSAQGIAPWETVANRTSVSIARTAFFLCVIGVVLTGAGMLFLDHGARWLAASIIGCVVSLGVIEFVNWFTP